MSGTDVNLQPSQARKAGASWEEKRLLKVGGVGEGRGGKYNQNASCTCMFENVIEKPIIM